MREFKFWMPFVVLLIGYNSSIAQNINISGVIQDQSTNRPVGDVTVSLKGYPIGSTTKDNGMFSITGRLGDTLIFTHINYQIKRIKIASKTLNISLSPKVEVLNDVVIVGYGSVNKKDFTGSVAQVNIKEMAKAPVMSFDQALAGRVAGVQVASQDGQPGSEGVAIVIRGAGSLTQNTSPLYVLDGVAMEDFNPSTLNMDDIAEFNVLKDASATAIYGARGANGVIIIQTKTGKVGPPAINYSGSFGFSKVTNQMNMMNPSQFVQYQIEKSPDPDIMITRYTPADLPTTHPSYNAQGKTLADYNSINGINWQDQAFKNGLTQIHNLSLSGGSDGNKYLISGSVYNQDGILLNSGSNRVTARIKADQKITSKLNTGINASYSNLNSNGQIAASNAQSGGLAFGYIMYSLWAFRPVTGNETAGEDFDREYLHQESDPTTGDYFFALNPIISLQNEDKHNKNNTLNANAYASFDFTKKLSLRTMASFGSNGQENTVFYNSKTNMGHPRGSRGLQGSVFMANSNSWQSSTTLTYRNRFYKDHDLTALLGTDFLDQRGKVWGYSSQLVPFEAFGVYGIDDGTPASTDARLTPPRRLQSHFGRFNYDFKSKYLLTATFRFDGSSAFSPNKKWGVFPSAALAWRLSREKFMKNLSFVSDAKFRLGYGATGNDRVPPFGYLSNIGNSTINEAYSFNNAEPKLGFSQISLGNPDLKWETTYQGNIGIDLSFLNRIDLVIDTYHKKTEDILLYANIPSHLGFNKTYLNIGAIQNKGLEVSLNTINIKKRNFNWTSNFNISFNRNKILALSNGEDKRFTAISWDGLYSGAYLYTAEVGMPAAMFMGYMFDGIYQYDHFNKVGENYILKAGITGNGTTRANIKPGDIKYKDLNGDLTVDAFDETIIGNPMPNHVGGFSNTFGYKGLSVNVFFQWSYGNEAYNANRIYFEGGRPQDSRNQFATYVNRWTSENPSNQYFRVGGGGPDGRYSSLYVEDASFLRLKTISVDYIIPVKFVEKIGLSSLGVSASAQNLHTWTRYSGMDPEVSTRNTILTPAFDWSAYPRAKTVVFGVKATL